ncbi:MAG: uncharacterized protein JWP91_789 [Fibrobacteres bacterium]|nr:uncharacterized protein [Fibrobacterota bacterium]
MKFIPPKIHGYLDYAVILVLALAPSIFRFVGEAATVTYALAALYLVLVLLTAYPLGVFKLIPFTIHGAIELVLSPLLIAMPWIAGFRNDDSARYFYIVAGVALFLVWLTTDYKAADLVYRRKGVDMGGQMGGRVRGAGA